MDLKALREKLSQTDDLILEMVAKRQALVREIGETKQQAHQPTRDYDREKEVLTRSARRASELGLEPDLANDLLRLLIRTSLTRQERDKVASSGHGDGRRALVIGGDGKMGRWFVEFLASQGFAVEVADPAGADQGCKHYDDWQDAKLDHDIIVVAAPLRETEKILRGLAGREIGGIIFDIGSLKSPLREALGELARRGHRVTSIHPMFGPDTMLLSERHVIFVDLGCAEATSEAKALFEPTMAIKVDMDLDDHDRNVAFVLGLSHAINIAFASVLADSGASAPDLARISSTTFNEQLAIARKVARENPSLYFEIQSLNAYGGQPIERLAAAIGQINQLVADEDEQGFIGMMQRGRDYFASLSPGP